MNVQVDPEQEQRPEQDREDRTEDEPPRPEMVEVVLLRRDCHADDHPDQNEQAAAEHEKQSSGRAQA